MKLQLKAASSTAQAAQIQAFEEFYLMRLLCGCGYTQIVMCTCWFFLFII